MTKINKKLRQQRRDMLVSAGLAVIAFAAIVFFTKITPAPAEIPVTQPKQPHYAVFYFVCGALQHVLLTTEPPLMANRLEPASQEMLDLMGQTPEERIIRLDYVGPECSQFPKPDTRAQND